MATSKIRALIKTADVTVSGSTQVASIQSPEGTILLGVNLYRGAQSNWAFIDGIEYQEHDNIWLVHFSTTFSSSKVRIIYC
jgi:hypothetical protein